MVMRILIQIAILASIPLAPAQGTQSYGLQVGAFAEQGAAESAAAKFSSLPSVRVIGPKEGEALPFKVIVGSFGCYADAWASRAIAKDSFIVGLAEASAGDRATFQALVGTATKVHEPATSMEQLLEMSGASGNPSAPEILGDRALEALSSEELLRLGRNAQTNADGIPALEAFLVRFPDHAEANSARLRLARRLMGRKDYERVRTLLRAAGESQFAEQRALAELLLAYAELYEHGPKSASQLFKTIAEKDDDPLVVRLEALRRYAGAEHATGDDAAAWTAFRELQVRALDAETRGEAGLELAGIAFELVGKGKGNWNEVRHFCALVAEDAETTSAQRATAALMNAETFHKEGRPQEAGAAAEALLVAFPNDMRTRTYAQLLSAASKAMAGNRDSAKNELIALADAEYPEKGWFSGKHPRAMALSWLAWIAYLEEDDSTLAEFARDLDAEFPNSESAKRVHEMMKNRSVNVPPSIVLHGSSNE